MPDDKIDYFIQQTNERLGQIDRKIDKLIQFKWQIVGGSVALSLLMTILIQVVFIK